jgi:hypothetical protein
MLTANRVICGDAKTTLAGLPAECVDLTVTSPPLLPPSRLCRRWTNRQGRKR